MKNILSRGALSSIVVTSIAGLGFVACMIDESGTNTSSSAASSSSSAASSGMGGESAGSTSSSSGTAGMGGAGGGSASSSSGVSSGGLGADCTLASQCASGVCEDGVCCAGACGECQSCNQANSKGTCKAVSEGTDDCMDNGELCSDMGTCACGISVPVTEDAPCPPDTVMPSRWTSNNGTCTYKCGATDECKNDPNVVCADGSHCVIECTGNGACEGTEFFCPKGHSCTMKCTNMDSCKNTILHCSDDGPCNIECTSDGNSCATTVNCGFNSCSATCSGSSKPTLVGKADSACAPVSCQ